MGTPRDQATTSLQQHRESRADCAERSKPRCKSSGESGVGGRRSEKRVVGIIVDATSRNQRHRRTPDVIMKELALEERIDAKIDKDIVALGRMKTMLAMGLGRRHVVVDQPVQQIDS